MTSEAIRRSTNRATRERKQKVTRSAGETAIRREKDNIRGGNFMPDKKHTSDRELIDTGRDKRFVRRDDQVKFKESDDVGKTLTADRRQKA